MNDSTDSDAAAFDLDSAKQTVLDSVQAIWDGLLGHLPQLVLAVLVLLATWGAVRLATAILRVVLDRTQLRGSLKDLFQQLASAVLWLGGLLAAAMIVFPGVTPGKLLTVLGLGSIAIGFAFKDIFENFFAGILILWRFPFEKDDFIEVGDIFGKVEDVTIRMTQIRQVDGQLVVLPNADLFKNPVRVVTNQDARRTEIMAGIAYDEDVDEARGVIQKAVEGCESVASDRDVQVFAQAFGASSVDFQVAWWTGSTPVDIRRSRDEVVAAIKRALDDAGIEIPFPYRTLTFKEPLRLVQQSGERAETQEAERAAS